VREMTQKLRAESIENRKVIAYDLLQLQLATQRIDADIVALNNCSLSPSAALQPLVRPLVLMPSDTAWSGIRDSALLPLMPDLLVDTYWKIDGTGDGFSRANQEFTRQFDQAAGAVATVRGGSTDREVCNAALLALNQLSLQTAGVQRVATFYRDINAQALRGERLDLAGQVLREHGQPVT